MDKRREGTIFVVLIQANRKGEGKKERNPKRKSMHIVANERKQCVRLYNRGREKGLLHNRCKSESVQLI